MATQTGSIDLAATNAVHLYAEAGFSNAEQTYATKSELEVTNEAVALRATKTEARTLANPNLTPFFSSELDDRYNVADNPTGFWYSTTSYSEGYVTKLADGWAHLERDNTSGTGTTYITLYTSSVWQQANMPIVPGGTYTVLAEVRNVTVTGEPYLTLVSTSSTPKGMFANGIGGPSSGPLADLDGELRGTTTARSDFSDCTSVTRTFIAIPAGASVSFDLRISIYEGDYTGPYKPYVGGKIYASSAELKITNDSISTKVEKNGVISAINQSAESIQIQADKVNIEGAAIFTGSGRLSEEALDGAYDANGAAAAVQDNLDNLEVGGRNLLAFSSRLSPNPWTSNGLTYTWSSDGWITVAGTCTNTAAAFGFTFGSGVQTFQYLPAGTYTLSVESENLLDGTNTYMVIQLTTRTSSDTTKYYTLNDSGSITGVADLYVSRVSMLLQAAANGKTYNGRIRFKLEKGNKATDWTPAPEDIDASIETASGNGYYVKWDSNQGTQYAGGEAKILAYDPVTKTAGTGDGWVLWNGVKRTVPSTDFNPNNVYPYNIPIYLVLRLSTATATTGTVYAVWYKDGWKWGYPNATTDGTIYNWRWVETTDIVLASCVEPGSEAQFTDCQTYDPPLSCTQVTTITTTASSAQALANTANTTANNAAPKANAVKRTQRIYYRSNSSTAPSTPGTASSNWVTKADDGNAAWTKMHVAISSTHKYIYTCEQYEMANGTIGYTSVLLDNTITVIDGGNIITGSVKANKLDTADINVSNSLTIGALSTDTQDDILNSNMVVGGRNLLLWTGEGETYSDHTGISRLWKYTTIYGDVVINGNTAVFTKNSSGLTDNTSGLRVMSLTESGGSASGNAGQSTQYDIDFKIGEQYTFSCDVKTDGNRVGLEMQHYNGTTVWDGVGVSEFVPVDTDWHRYSFTFTIPSDFVCITALGVYCQLLEGVKLELKNVKLERGNKPTEWTPAPEDTDAAIDSKADATEGIEYIVGTHGTTATGTWTGTTKDAALYVGKQIAYYLTSNGVSGTASTLNLTLSGGGETGAKNVRLNNTNVTNHYPANTILKLTYDGTYWKCDNYNSDTYDRENYKVALAASSAISAGRIAVVGSDGKLKLLSASAFDYTKPILYVGTAYSATNVTDGTTRTSNYTFWGTAFNLTNTHAIAGAAAGKAVYIVGTLSGTTFTPNSTVLTCTTPTSANGLVYLRLGIMSTASNAVLESDHPLYMYHNGAFQPCDPATVSASQTATTYLTHVDNDGLTVHDANAPTTGVKITDSVDILRSGVSTANFGGGTNGDTARVGPVSGNHISIDSDSVDILKGSLYVAGFEGSSVEEVGPIATEKTDTLKIKVGTSGDIDISATEYRMWENGEPEPEAPRSKEASFWIQGDSDETPDEIPFDHSAGVNLSVEQGYGAMQLYGEYIGMSDPYDMDPEVQIQLGKPTSIYSTGNVSVANSSWVKVAQLTIPSTGTWLVVLSGDFASNATGRRLVACARNAVPSSAPNYDSQNSLAMAPANGAATKFSSSAIIDFTADDVYYAAVWQNSGGALTTRIMIKAVRLI